MAETGLKARKNSKKGKMEQKVEVVCNECSETCLEDDKMIINCDLCKNYYHKGCTSIKNTEWKVLTANQNILYSCDNCLEKKGNEATELKEIKEMLQDNLRETKLFMTTMEEKIYRNVDKLIEEKLGKQSQTQDKLENMMKEVKEAEINIEKKIHTEVKIYLDNQKEKENKVNNIMVLRLKEPAGNDEQEQIENDRNEIKKLFHKTNPELTAEIETVLNTKKSFRLGRKRDDAIRPRPIKIELPDEEMKKQIFKGCRNLKESEYRLVSIQNDLTKAEQEQNYKLRQELKERRGKGEQVCIYNGQVIEEKDHPRHK